MSFLAIAVPAEAAVATLPILARSAVGFGVFGILITLVLTFKPFLKGLLRTLLLVLTPRARTITHAGRAAAASLLQRLANDFEATQPSQAAELRRLASRG